MTYPLQQQINDQARWIDEHGGDLAGYVARYGSSGDPKHYGDGGEAIFAADYNALLDLVACGMRRGMFDRFIRRI